MWQKAKSYILLNRQYREFKLILNFFMKYIFSIVAFFLILTLHIDLHAQNNIYVAGSGPGGFAVGYYNVETCTFCVEMEISTSFFDGTSGDLVPLPNGNIVMTGQQVIYQFNPPNPNPIVTLNTPGIVFTGGGVIAPNGNVYFSTFTSANGLSNLHEYNPTTNTLVLVSSFPAGSSIGMTEIFYWNGILYAFIIDNGSSALAEIIISNPLAANIVHTYPQALCGSHTAVISSGPNAGIYTQNLDFSCDGNVLLGFDIPSNNTTAVCQSPTGIPGVYGMGNIPAGFPPPSVNCNCTTNAGTLPQAGPYNICTNSTLNFPTATGTTLDANDLLRYILFSNPADTAGSIVAVSSTPSFTFNSATMQTGVTYYVAAMAGNGVSGNIDLNDPCLDFSNALQVVWRPLPTVTFSSANPNICAGGCTSVIATFTGTAPFTLTYVIPNSGPLTRTFANNTGTFQVCIPTGAAAGNAQMAATRVVDSWCTCE
jgi:hypothetical protein